MKADNRAFLDEYRHFYDKMQTGSGTIHMTLDDRKRLQEIIREEWDKTYATCITCNEGVIDLLKMAYNNYNSVLEAEKAQSSTNTLLQEKPAKKPRK